MDTSSPLLTESASALLDRYDSLYRVPDDDVRGIVRNLFAPDAVFESTHLDTPIVGHTALTEHIMTIRQRIAGLVVLRLSAAQWSGQTVRWCWSISNGSNTVVGTDMLQASTDFQRVLRLSVFEGLTPPLLNG